LPMVIRADAMEPYWAKRVGFKAGGLGVSHSFEVFGEAQWTTIALSSPVRGRSKPRHPT
jgi:hypothetical protein